MGRRCEKRKVMRSDSKVLLQKIGRIELLSIEMRKIAGGVVLLETFMNFVLNKMSLCSH